MELRKKTIGERRAGTEKRDPKQAAVYYTFLKTK